MSTMMQKCQTQLHAVAHGRDFCQWLDHRPHREPLYRPGTGDNTGSRALTNQDSVAHGRRLNVAHGREHIWHMAARLRWHMAEVSNPENPQESFKNSESSEIKLGCGGRSWQELARVWQGAVHM